MIATIAAIHEAIKKSAAREQPRLPRLRSQSVKITGRMQMSANKYRKQISHDAFPKVCANKTPEKPNATALIKHTIIIMIGLSNEKEKYERIRGKKVAANKPTIDTGCKTALRINGRNNGLYTQTQTQPSNRPKNQHRASRKQFILYLEKCRVWLAKIVTKLAPP